MQRCFVPSLSEIGLVVPEKKISKFPQFTFAIFVIKTVWPFIWVPFIRWYFVPSLIGIGQIVLEMEILIFRQYIFAISWLFPIEKELGPSFE